MQDGNGKYTEQYENKDGGRDFKGLVYGSSTIRAAAGRRVLPDVP